jgi:hypothetical protein
MRTTYTGPVKNRGVNAQGKANVSREELEDFKRKYGANKTLRDLLNADKTGKTPLSEESPLARGKQGASIEPSRVSMSPARREAMDRASENARKREEGKKASIARQEAAASQGMDRLKKAGAVPGLVMQGMMEGAERVPPGRGLGAMFIGGAGAGPRTAGMASKAGEAVKGAASKAGEAVKGAASKAGEAVKGAVERRAAAKAAPERKEPPSLYPEPPKTGGVFSSARRGTRGEQQAAGRKATEDYARDVMERGAEMGMKRGGNVKSYAKGGMTKGGGCETRGKKARYV